MNPDLQKEEPGTEDAPAALAALSGEAGEPPDPDATRLEQDAAPDLNAWLEHIQAMLETAESLEEFRTRLLAAYPDMDRNGMVAAMSAAFAAAHLAGMDDAAR